MVRALFTAILLVSIGAAARADVAGPAANRPTVVEPEPAPVEAPGPAADGEAEGPVEPVEPGAAAPETDGAGAPAGDDPPAATPQPAPLPAIERSALGVTPAAREGAPAEADAGFPGGSVVRTVAALALVVALIVGLKVAGTRLARGVGSLRSQLGAGGRSPSGVLQVLGRYPVARGQTLVLLKLDRRVLLLCQTGAGFTTLAEITDPEEVASLLSGARDDEETSISARFNGLLRAMERDPDVAGTEGVEARVGVPVDGGPRSLRRAFDAGRAAPSDAPDPAEDPGELRRRLDAIRGLGL